MAIVEHPSLILPVSTHVTDVLDEDFGDDLMDADVILSMPEISTVQDVTGNILK